MGDFSGYLDYFKFCFIYTWTSQTFLYRFGFSIQTWSSTIPDIGVIYATRTIDAVRIHQISRRELHKCETFCK